MGRAAVARSSARIDWERCLGCFRTHALLLALFLPLLASGAEAGVGDRAGEANRAWKGSPIEKVQYFSFDDQDYCWYDDGWNGPGWYWCGYESDRGRRLGRRLWLERLGRRSYHPPPWSPRRRRLASGSSRPSPWRARGSDGAALAGRRGSNDPALSRRRRSLTPRRERRRCGLPRSARRRRAFPRR